MRIISAGLSLNAPSTPFSSETTAGACTSESFVSTGIKFDLSSNAANDDGTD